MIRTLISISENDKNWLERYSHKKHQSVAQTVRAAIQNLRKQSKLDSWKNTVYQTKGVWKHKKIDAQKYVANLRSEWDR